MKDSDPKLWRFLLNENKEEEEANIQNWIKSSPENENQYLKLKRLSELIEQYTILKGFDRQGAKKKVKERLNIAPKIRFIDYWQRVASILIIPLIMLFVADRIFESAHIDQIVYNEVQASFGNKSNLELPDGSQVWLNSGSKIKYPVQFTSKQRKVFLEGEAFFKVKSDKSSPFIVNTREIDVTATGTAFNVSAYKNNEDIIVTLNSGKVFLSRNGKNISGMVPGLQAVFNGASKSVQLAKVDAEKYSSWRNGKLIFRRDPMSEVIKRLERWYNVEIELEGVELTKYEYTATFVDETLEQALELLKMSAPLTYEVGERTINKDGTFSKNKIIIKKYSR